jgi:GTP-binding protein
MTQNPRILQWRMTAPGTDPEIARRALAWAHGARFFTTASQLHQLPLTELPEIAFVGRSNAGKSTAINTLAQHKRLAFASKTPGRTQHINLFALGPADTPDALWADLPGYGYAAVERDAKLRWQQVMADYLAQPRVRTGAVKLLVLLTKADKLSRKQADASLQAAVAALGAYASDESHIGATLFSALKRTGIEDAATTLHGWVHG